MEVVEAEVTNVKAIIVAPHGATHALSLEYSDVYTLRLVEHQRFGGQPSVTAAEDAVTHREAFHLLAEWAALHGSLDKAQLYKAVSNEVRLQTAPEKQDKSDPNP
eukprot:2007833-Prymnesium_polylepis.1